VWEPQRDALRPSDAERRVLGTHAEQLIVPTLLRGHAAGDALRPMDAGASGDEFPRWSVRNYRNIEIRRASAAPLPQIGFASTALCRPARDHRVMGLPWRLNLEPAPQ
jgi:hypothetical protein